MADGVPYDSDAGRGTAAAITALMTGRGYLGSARIAAEMGPYDRYAENRDAHNAVMRMHRDAAYAIDDTTCVDDGLLIAARSDVGRGRGRRGGARLPQCAGHRAGSDRHDFSFLMDCDTTGVEPDFSLVKFKELVGGGQMTIVNRTVPLALQTLGYTDEQIEQIVAYVNEHGTIIGAPGLADEHLPVFDVAVGERAISHMGHIKMMGAVQPFISGAISKTVNLPETATVERHRRRLPPGLAARDQGAGDLPRRLQDRPGAAHRRAEGRARARVRHHGGRHREGGARRRWPRRRRSAGGCHASASRSRTSSRSAATRATSPPGCTRTGSVGEIFLTDIGKEGSTLRGMMNSFATAISISLQYGVPLETLVRKFSYMRFEPEGMTSNPEIPFAKSMPDYIMRWLASRFLDADLQEELGILTPEVRARKAAQDAASHTRATRPGRRGAASRTDARATGQDRRQRRERRSASGPAATSAPRPATAALTDTPPVLPAVAQGPRPRPGLPAMRRHDAAHRQLLHVLELRVQHRLRLMRTRASAVGGRASWALGPEALRGRGQWVDVRAQRRKSEI